MKILHINLAKGFRGGERQTEILIRTLAKSPNIQQFLACRKDSPLRSQLTSIDNLEFIVVNNQFYGHFNTPKVDILHAHDAKAVHWAWLHSLLKKTPYIITRRVDQPIKDKWLSRKTYSRASSVVAISSLIKQYIEKKEWNKNIRLIPSVMAEFKINREITTQYKEKFGNKLLIGNAGALVDKHKGQRLLIEVARNLEESHPHFQFIFFGRGKDELILKEETKDLKNITWAGFKDNIADYLAALDIFVFPSRNEGLGSTLLDVMNAEVPIIAANVGGIPDIVIHDKTGLLFKVNSSSSLEKALLKIVEHPSLRYKYTKNAKNQLKNYSPDTMASSYLKLYSEVII